MRGVNNRLLIVCIEMIKCNLSNQFEQGIFTADRIAESITLGRLTRRPRKLAVSALCDVLHSRLV